MIQILNKTLKILNKVKPFLMTLLLITHFQLLINAAHAQHTFFDRHAEGWHWYQGSDQLSELPQAELSKVELPKAGVSNQKKENPQTQTPTQMIEGQRKKLEQKLHAAIVEPTREKIMAYILAQKALMDQSQRFSESWQRVLMTTPALDETLVHPVDQNARHVYYQERNQEITSRIKALAQEYGLFFFFKGECAYCHHFAPVVKHFAQKHGWSVLGISMDGGMLPEFPNAKRDNGMTIRLQISHVPALIAYHPSSGDMIPLAYGLISESEIEERVILLSNQRTNLLTQTSPSDSPLHEVIYNRDTLGKKTHEVRK